ncbi:MAG: MBL fold metallo-hydrolase [Bacteroidia bacterium]
MSIQFGGKITKADLARYALSPNWKDGSFKNQEETSVGPEFYKIPGMIYKQIRGKKESEPASPLPVIPFEKNVFLNPSPAFRFAWYGHSAVLLRISGKTLLIDPMLGPNASPIGPITTRRFSENTLQLIDDFPEIDILLLTHDHYDHLDMDSIEKLKPKTQRYFVALGVKRHLVSWGVAPELITEFDWWDTQTVDELTVHFTPTRHFSGRGLSDRAKSLWGGWAFKTVDESVWFSGDGGYGPHFKEVGRRLGPFDFAFMECGQYCDDWPLIHMFPGEAVQAAQDAGAKTAMPVHWAGFSLSYYHSWKEPADHFVFEAEKKGLLYLTPQLGELITRPDQPFSHWWEKY